MSSLIAVTMAVSSLVPASIVYAGEGSSAIENGTALLSSGAKVPQTFGAMPLGLGCSCVIHIDEQTAENINLGAEDNAEITYSDKLTDPDCLIDAGSVHVIWNKDCSQHGTLTGTTKQKEDAIKDELFISEITETNASRLFKTVELSPSIKLTDVSDTGWKENEHSFNLEIGVGFDSVLNGVTDTFAFTSKTYNIERDAFSEPIKILDRAYHFGTMGDSTVPAEWVTMKVEHPSIDKVRFDGRPYVSYEPAIYLDAKSGNTGRAIQLHTVKDATINSGSIDIPSSQDTDGIIEMQISLNQDIGEIKEVPRYNISAEVDGFGQIENGQILGQVCQSIYQIKEIKYGYSDTSRSEENGIIEEVQKVNDLDQFGIIGLETENSNVTFNLNIDTASTEQIEKIHYISLAIEDETGDVTVLNYVNPSYTGDVPELDGVYTIKYPDVYTDKCTCHWVLTNQRVSITKNFGQQYQNVSFKMGARNGKENFPLNVDYLDYTWEPTCPLHTTEPLEQDVKNEIAIENIAYKSVSGSINASDVNVVDGLTTIDFLSGTSGMIVYTASLGESMLETPIPIEINATINRDESKAPEIISHVATMDGLEVIVKDNINKFGTLYLNGTEVEYNETTAAEGGGNGEFKFIDGERKLSVPITENNKPTITGITALRNTDKTVTVGFSMADSPVHYEMYVEGHMSGKNSTLVSGDYMKQTAEGINSYLEYRLVDKNGAAGNWQRTVKSNLDNSIKINNVDLYSKIELRAIDLNGEYSDVYEVPVTELPCICDIEYMTRSISTSMGAAESGIVNMSAYMVDIRESNSPIESVTIKCDSMCPLHGGTTQVEEREGYRLSDITEVVSITTGTATLTSDDTTGDILIAIEDMTAESADLVLRGKLKKSELEVYDVEFSIKVNRTYMAPGIKSFKYVASTNRATITGVPNGNSSANMYVDGVYLKKVSFQFRRQGGFFGFGGVKVYVDTDFSFDLRDTVAPKETTSLGLARKSTDKTKAILSWSNGTDTDNFVPVKLVANGKESNEMQVNAKSAKTTKEIIIYGKDGNELKKYRTDVDNKYEIPVLDLYYGGYITVQVFDENSNASAIQTLYIPNEVVYNTVVVNDRIYIDEGSMEFIDVKINDTHDEAYGIPLLESAQVVSGDGTVTMVDAADITDNSSGMTGLVLSVAATDGYLGDIVIRYTYAKVRDDIPPATGLATVTVKPRNQEPVAVDDGEDVTASVGAEGNTTFYIPTSLILANDTDRERDEMGEPVTLKVTAVRNCSAGTITYEEANNRIKIVPKENFYGYMTFEYRITDGKDLSRFWGKVTVYVKNDIRPPVAKPVATTMEATATEGTIMLNVENPSAVPYTLDGNITVYQNGVAIDKHYVEATTGTVYDNELGFAKPYIKLLVHNKSGVSMELDDEFTMSYTVRNQKGSSSSTIKVTITVGDDPYDMEGYLYVHRRPLALFGLKVNKDASGTRITSINLANNQESSYDLDHQAQHAEWNSSKPYTYKGIRTWEWGVKTLDGNWVTKQFDADSYLSERGAETARQKGIAWVNTEANKLIAANPDKSVVVALRVRDVDGPENVGEWSEQRSMLLASIPMKPVAQFTLDKSTYIVDKNAPFSMTITDLSYDSNGDKIIRWEWELTPPTGTGSPIKQVYDGTNDASGLVATFTTEIKKIVTSSSYNPADPTFKISLVVIDNSTVDIKERTSDKYSVSFKVYLDNSAPVIGDNGKMNISTTTVYEEDDGIDGTKGDNWGTLGNTTKPGTLPFNKLFNITDDQSTTYITMDWMFDGQTVQKRMQYVDGKDSDVMKMYRNKKANPFTPPFTGTVTTEGFKPGAYKLTVSATDAPDKSGNHAYMPGSSKTTYWNTYSDRNPYHVYVVPKLDMYFHNEVNGWIDQSYRMEGDTKVYYTDDGLELEDIAPTIGDTVRFYGKTNKYVTAVYVFNDLNNNNKLDIGEDKIKLTNNGGMNMDTTRDWEATYLLEDVAEAPEGSDLVTLNIKIVAETTWGGENGEVTRTKMKTMGIEALPVKLYDFRVTSLTDPDVYQDFSEYLDKLKTLGVTLPSGNGLDGIPVGKLAIDRTTTAANVNGTANGDKANAISKGYSFYFKVSSKGMAKEDDDIRIIPRFYEAKFDENGRTVSVGNELIGYLPDRNGVYRMYTQELPDTVTEKAAFEQMYKLYYEGNKTHSLNTHYNVIIPPSLRTEDGNSQTWSGRYGIPADAKFFRNGTTPSIADEYKGDILITFDITAYKKGKSRYNYVERGQWLKERNVLPDALKDVYKAKEALWKSSDIFGGAIITFDVTRSMVDNYTSNPVWRE